MVAYIAAVHVFLCFNKTHPIPLNVQLVTLLRLVIVMMLFASTPGVVVSYLGFNDVRYATMLSGNWVKTLRCSYDELYDPLRLTMLSGNGAQV